MHVDKKRIYYPDLFYIMFFLTGETLFKVMKIGQLLLFIFNDFKHVISANSCFEIKINTKLTFHLSKLTTVWIKSLVYYNYNHREVMPFSA